MASVTQVAPTGKEPASRALEVKASTKVKPEKKAPQPVHSLDYECGDRIVFTTVTDSLGMPMRACTETRLLSKVSLKPWQPYWFHNQVVSMRGREIVEATIHEVTLEINSRDSEDKRIASYRPIDLLGLAITAKMTIAECKVRYYFVTDVKDGGSLYEMGVKRQTLCDGVLVNLAKVAEGNADMIGYSMNLMDQAARRIMNAKDIGRGTGRLFSTADNDYDLVDMIKRWQRNQSMGK
nr:hypothetical protein [Tolivirales sp.]